MYDVIYSYELSELIILVNSRIKMKQGWEPLGGVCAIIDSSYSTSYYQAMIQKVGK